MSHTMYWCDEIWRSLIEAHRRNHLSHALLFIGQAGLGKKELAQQLAHYMLCSSLEKVDAACGKCKDCLLLHAKTHGDFYDIFSENNKSIGIDQIRQLKLDAYQTSQRGQAKIFLIACADNMTIAAANALLKILEEPPSRCFFILTSESKQALPATILSRCQQYAFFPVYNEQARTWLLQKTMNTEYSCEEIDAALQWSCGAPLLAITLLEKDKIKDFQSLALLIEKFLLQKIHAHELIKSCQGKSLADILYIGYLVAHRLLKNNQVTHKVFLYHWLDKAEKTKKLLATQIALNEGLLIETIFNVS